MTTLFRSHIAALLALTAFVTVTAATLATTDSARADQTTPTMTLTATGEVSAAPDTALVTSGVITQADSARAALTANTRAMSTLLDAIKSAGIEPRDIQTNGFSVTPRYEQRNDKNGAWQSPRVIGYQVNNGVGVRVRVLSKLGGLLDTMVSQGANNIAGIQFLVSDADKRRDEARKEAVAAVRHKGELYAKAAGVTLARIVSISENSNNHRPRPMYMEARAKAADMAVPVAAGEETLSVTVSMTWELEP